MIEDAFARHLRSGAEPPEGLFASGRPDRRFAVYRNNVVHSLTTALATRFPATQRLLGIECFQACAQLFVESYKPISPVMMFYGDDFPAYLTTLPSLTNWPFLADVARIEVARTRAYHAIDRAPLRLKVGDADEIETYLNRVFNPHPAASVFHSPYPAGTIWAASGTEEALPPEAWRDETIAVTRAEYEVQVSLVPRGTSICIDAICKGVVLGEAIAIACHADEEYDPALILATLLRCNLLADPQQESDHESS
jgi:hypothetical protein